MKLYTKSIKRYSKNENFLINTFVFFIFWNFFTAFPVAFNGFFRSVLEGRLGVLFIIVQIIIFTYYLSQKKSYFPNRNQKYAGLFTFSLLFIWFVKLICTGQIDNTIISPIFSVSFLIMLRDDLKIECLNRFINVLAIILALSLVEYIIFVLFHVGYVLYSGLERAGADDYYMIQIYEQHIFNVIISGADFPRFQSLCEEPGVVGTICGFLTFTTKGRVEYKFQYIIFIIAGALSFSLAFFALFAMHLLIMKKETKSTIFILAAIIVLAYIYFYEFFEYRLFFRLQEEGIDNRVTGDFDFAFEKAFESGQLLLPQSDTKSAGAGAKMWIWRYGLISLVVLVFSYSYYFFEKIKQYMTPRVPCIIFYIAFWISFYQRHWITNLDYMIAFLTIPILYGEFPDKKNYKINIKNKL